MCSVPAEWSSVSSGLLLPSGPTSGNDTAHQARLADTFVLTATSRLLCHSVTQHTVPEHLLFASPHQGRSSGHQPEPVSRGAVPGAGAEKGREVQCAAGAAEGKGASLGRMGSESSSSEGAAEQRVQCRANGGGGAGVKTSRYELDTIFRPGGVFGIKALMGLGGMLHGGGEEGGPGQAAGVAEGEAALEGQAVCSGW